MGGVEVQLQPILDEGEGSASLLGSFNPGKDPRYPLDRMKGEPQKRSGYGGHLR